MNNTYSKVPNIITNKDLDYLSDMFSWNYNAYKLACNYLDNIKSEEVKCLVDKVGKFCYANMQQVLNILQEGGYDNANS